MNTFIFKTNEELDEAGAGIMTGLIQTNPRAILGLATGSSPIGIYRELVSSYRKGAVSFKQVTTFNLDEYVGLPVGHPESYRSFMEKHLFGQVDLQPKRTYIPNGHAGDLEAECRRYDELLENAKQIDLQILGIGLNGHIGFNEPNHSLTGGTHVVKLNDSTRQANARFFSSMDEVPSYALTMGVGTILKAKTILLIVRGAEKAEIVHRALTGPIQTEIPASLLQTHPNVVVMMDQDAGRCFQ